MVRAFGFDLFFPFFRFLILSFTVVIQQVLESNKLPKLQLPVLISTIQNARRLIAYRQEGVQVPQNEGGDNGRQDRQLIVDIDARMTEILNAISNFSPDE